MLQTFGKPGQFLSLYLENARMEVIDGIAAYMKQYGVEDINELKVFEQCRKREMEKEKEDNGILL